MIDHLLNISFNMKNLIQFLLFAVLTAFIAASCADTPTPSVVVNEAPSQAIDGQEVPVLDTFVTPDTPAKKRKIRGQAAYQKPTFVQEDIFRVERGPDGILYLVNDGKVFIPQPRVEMLAESDSMAKANPYLHAYCRAAAALMQSGEEGGIDIHNYLDDAVSVKGAGTTMGYDTSKAFIGIVDVAFEWKGSYVDTRHLVRWAENIGLDPDSALALRSQFVYVITYGAMCDGSPKLALVRCAALLRAVSGSEDGLDQYCRFYQIVQNAEK